MMESFRSGVSGELKHYVYMLIDPRNGQTFYVGRGQGDRVFAHVNGAEEDMADREEDNELPLKLRVIHEIKNAGLEPIHVIHRHGMEQDAAVEVEAALIDAIPGLTNIAAGHGSNERGPAHAKELNDQYAAEVAKFDPDDKLLIIKIRKDVVDSNDGNIYRTVRASWKLNPDRAAGADYVLAVVGGVCKGVFVANKWRPATKKENEHQRHEFDGQSAPAELVVKYKNKLIPPEYRKSGMASPVLYVGC